MSAAVPAEVLSAQDLADRCPVGLTIRSVRILGEYPVILTLSNGTRYRLLSVDHDRTRLVGEVIESYKQMDVGAFSFLKIVFLSKRVATFRI